MTHMSLTDVDTDSLMRLETIAAKNDWEHIVTDAKDAQVVVAT